MLRLGRLWGHWLGRNDLGPRSKQRQLPNCPQHQRDRMKTHVTSDIHPQEGMEDWGPKHLAMGTSIQTTRNLPQQPGT